MDTTGVSVEIIGQGQTLFLLFGLVKYPK